MWDMLEKINLSPAHNLSNTSHVIKWLQGEKKDELQAMVFHPLWFGLWGSEAGKRDHVGILIQVKLFQKQHLAYLNRWFDALIAHWELEVLTAPIPSILGMNIDILITGHVQVRFLQVTLEMDKWEQEHKK